MNINNDKTPHQSISMRALSNNESNEKHYKHRICSKKANSLDENRHRHCQKYRSRSRSRSRSRTRQSSHTNMRKNTMNKSSSFTSYAGHILEDALSQFELRGIVLLIEQEIEGFVKHSIDNNSSSNNNNNEYVLLFPPCNSFYRLLIHKIAERFGCVQTKSFGDGIHRRIFVYAKVNPNKNKNNNILCIPNRLKHVYCFIPILKLCDLYFGSEKHNILINKSLKHITEILKPNKTNTYNKPCFCKVSVDIKTMSHNIECKNAMYTHYLWRNIFEKSLANSNEKQKHIVNDINPKDVNCNHIIEIEQCKESKDNLMDLLVKYVNSKHSLCIKRIDNNHILIVFKEKIINLEVVLNGFYEYYNGIYNGMFKINELMNGSDLSKYYCGFVNEIMNKTRGQRDVSIAKRMIGNVLHSNSNNKVSRENVNMKLGYVAEYNSKANKKYKSNRLFQTALHKTLALK